MSVTAVYRYAIGQCVYQITDPYRLVRECDTHVHIYEQIKENTLPLRYMDFE